MRFDLAAAGDSGPAVTEPILEEPSRWGIPPDEMLPESAALDSALPDRPVLPSGHTSAVAQLRNSTPAAQQHGRGETGQKHARDPVVELLIEGTKPALTPCSGRLRPVCGAPAAAGDPPCVAH